MTLCDPSRFNQRNTDSALALALQFAKEDWYTFHPGGRITRVSFTPTPFAWERVRRPPVVNPK